MFQETQTFSRLWFVALAVIFIVPLFFLDFNSFTKTLGFFILNLLFFLLLFYFILIVIKLKTNVDEQGVIIYWSLYNYQLLKRNYTWAIIKDAKLESYSSFIGYGIRTTKKYGLVYSARGKEGLLLTLKNNSKFMIGTQLPDDLYHTVSKHLRLTAK